MVSISQPQVLRWRWWDTSAGIACVVLVLNLVWFAIAVAGHDPARRALVGREVLRTGAGHSQSIDALDRVATTRIGYDGQFDLYIALSPTHAVSYMQDPAYRYERILYPVVGRAVAVGQPSVVPYALVLVNIAAATLLSLFAALYLARRGVSPGYALIAGLTPGLGIAVARDLNEPLAYALVALGLLAFYTAERHRVLLAGATFGLAGLARESTLLFAIAVATCLAFGIDEYGQGSTRKVKGAAALAALACAPIATWKLVLAQLVGGPSVPTTVRPELVPFAGIFGRSPFGGSEFAELLVVVLPGTIALLLAAMSVRRVCVPLVALLLNWIVLIALLPKRSYEGVPTTARVTIALPLAFVFCLPLIAKSQRGRAVVAPLLCWMLAWL